MKGDFSWAASLSFPAPGLDFDYADGVRCHFKKRGLPVTEVAADGDTVWLVGNANDAFTSTDIERIVNTVPGVRIGGMVCTAARKVAYTAARESIAAATCGNVAPMKLTKKEIEEFGGGTHELNVRLTRLTDPEPTVVYKGKAMVRLVLRDKAYREHKVGDIVELNVDAPGVGEWASYGTSSVESDGTCCSEDYLAELFSV